MQFQNSIVDALAGVTSLASSIRRISCATRCRSARLAGAAIDAARAAQPPRCPGRSFTIRWRDRCAQERKRLQLGQRFSGEMRPSMADVAQVADATEFRVFISSPSDVEKRSGRGAMPCWRGSTATSSGCFKFTGIRWEQSFYTADKIRSRQRSRHRRVHIVVCIRWQRAAAGLQPNDGTGRTSTEYEFEEARCGAEGRYARYLRLQKARTRFFDAERVEKQADLRALKPLAEMVSRRKGPFHRRLRRFRYERRIRREARSASAAMAERSEQVTCRSRSAAFRSLEPFEAEPEISAIRRRAANRRDRLRLPGRSHERVGKRR